MVKTRLLIVEDDEDLRTQMRWALAEEYEVFQAGDRPAALEVVRTERPPLVTLDLGLPPKAQEAEEGFATLSEILEAQRGTKVIVITGRAEREYALASVAAGAYDYFSKPIEIEELKVVLRRAVHLFRIESEHRELQRAVGGDSFEGMLGTGPRIQEVFAAIRKVATTDVSVLILGESGSGKELVARAIHRQSARRDEAFVAINCGAIPENLLESELFGHEKGAFTGAHVQRKGRIEASHKGTLFLDEIGELPLALQVKLLRFLQDRRIERVGGRQEISVDARLLAATNVDLQQAMAQGRFREDLYYRLGVVTIGVPPLRERGEDIALLAQALLTRFSGEMKKRLTGYTREALRALETYHWPGNVRELENRIKRAVVMAEGPRLRPEDLELASHPAGRSGPKLREARDALEHETIVRTLARNKGNVSKTAIELGVSRPTLYSLMERLGIGKDKT